MARYYKKRRYYRKKGRWSANIKTISLPSSTVDPGSFFYVNDLCVNPPQSDSTVSQQYTVKNIEFTFEYDANNQPDKIENITGYIMYVPQGMTVTETFPNYHPEYIMACRFIGTPNGAETAGTYRNPIKIKTRLARRLQTGDKIVFLLTGTNEQTIQLSLGVHGLLRWWTKAN